MIDPRAELAAGRRVRVTLRPGDGGFVYRRGDQYVYDVREGWGEGVVEAICFTDSDYIVGFLDGCEQIDVESGGRWVTVKPAPAIAADGDPHLSQIDVERDWYRAIGERQ